MSILAHMQYTIFSAENAQKLGDTAETYSKELLNLRREVASLREEKTELQVRMKTHPPVCIHAYVLVANALVLTHAHARTHTTAQGRRATGRGPKPHAGAWRPGFCAQRLGSRGREGRSHRGPGVFDPAQTNCACPADKETGLDCE